MREHLLSIFEGVGIGILLTIVLLFMIPGCKDNPGNSGDTPDLVARVEISSSKTELWVDDTLQLTAKLFSFDGTPLNNRSITWKSAHPNIIQTNHQGFLEAVGTGKATITATCETVADTITIDVYSYELIYEVTVDGKPTLYSLSLDEAVTPRQINGIEPFAYEPAASPDGNFLAYVSMDNEFNPELYLYEVSTKTSERLTYDSDIDDMAAWSPDGTKIVFRSNMEKKIADILIFDLSKKSLTNLTPDPPGIGVEERQPAWSPDGGKIVYSSTYAGTMDLWMMNTDGSGKIQLTNTEDYDTEASWSPDGTKILFRRWSEVRMALMLYDVSTKQIDEIIMPGQQRMPVWSPDGRWIAFVSHPTMQERPEIYMMRPDGSDLQLITKELSWGGGQNPTFRKLNKL